MSSHFWQIKKQSGLVHFRSYGHKSSSIYEHSNSLLLSIAYSTGWQRSGESFRAKLREKIWTITIIMHHFRVNLFCHSLNSALKMSRGEGSSSFQQQQTLHSSTLLNCQHLALRGTLSSRNDYQNRARRLAWRFYYSSQRLVPDVWYSTCDF